LFSIIVIAATFAAAVIITVKLIDVSSRMNFTFFKNYFIIN